MTETKRPLFRGLVEDFRALWACPRDLWIIFAVKYLESIAYFAVVGVLILYLHDDLRFSDESSGAIFGFWGTLISLTTFLAGFVADAMGQRKALLVGALTLVVGRSLLLFSEITALPLIGLCISVWGVASLKPVMTAAIKSYAPGPIRAFAYNIFYVIMNLGAFTAGHVVSFLRVSLIGRAIRPSDLFGDAPRLASEDAREALIVELAPQLRELAVEGSALTDREVVDRFARVATGGRSIEHWDLRDLDLIQRSLDAQAAGLELPAAPWALSGHEMIFLVAAFFSLCCLWLLRAIRADKLEENEITEHSEGANTVLESGDGQGKQGIGRILRQALHIGRSLLKEQTFRAYLLFISVLVMVRAIFVHAHSTWPTYMIRSFGEEVPQAAIWSINPLLIIFLTPIIGSLTSRFSAWSVIMWGSFITAASVLFMVVPAPFEALASQGLQALGAHDINPALAAPILFVVVLSLGEALWSPRLYEYVAVMAPKGREASYMGLTQLPMFGAKPLVGLMSGMLLANYCPEDGPAATETLWLIVFAVTISGPIFALFFSTYIRSAERTRMEEDAVGA